MAPATNLRLNLNASDLSDESLIELIISTKDNLLFEILYDRYAKMVYNKCAGFSKNGQEAEDLTQDVFFKLFVKLSTFKGISKFSTWLYAFTYNHCINFVNRNVAKKIEKKSVGTDNIEGTSFDPQEDDNDVYQLKIEKLKVALEKISPQEKMILLLKYQDYLTIRELEDIFHISQSAVKMRLKRAKDKFKSVYSDYGINTTCNLLRKV